MKKLFKNSITMLLAMAMIFSVPVFSKADTGNSVDTQTGSLDIIKVEGASVKLDGQEVTQIVPTANDNAQAVQAPEYEVVLPKWGYGDYSHISIPVKITERGYLNVNAEAIDVTDMIHFTISTVKEPQFNDEGEPDYFYTIGNFINENNYNMTRGCSIFEPGMYYIKFYAAGMDLPQNFTFDTTFTKADSRTLENGKSIRTAGLNDSSVYYKVVTNKAGIIKIEYKQGKYTQYYSKPDGGNFTLCNSKKKPIAKVQSIHDSGSLNWYAEKGSYYIRANVDDLDYDMKYTWHALLKTPTVNKLKVGSKTISGTALKNTTVNLKIDNETKIYTAKVNSKGKYTIDLKGKTVSYGDTYSIYLTDSKGKMSKTITTEL